MIEEFVYVGTEPAKEWADFHWADVATSKTDLVELLNRLDGRRRTFLIVSEKVGWEWLLAAIASQRSPHRWRSRVLGLTPTAHPWEKESVLNSRFDVCVPRPPVMLPLNELAEVLQQPNLPDFCIGGSIYAEHGMVGLVRGSLDVLSVRMAMFTPSGDGTQPDFEDFEVTDYGQTLRFGSYEASFDAVLYEVDSDYRRRLNKKRREEDLGFGASLRRLRLQRGFSREDFGGVSSKTIARIERGEVEKPHNSTLKAIAERLGVAVEEIESY